MRPARLWISCLAVSLLFVVNFSYAEKKDKGPNTDAEGRETIAKPLTDKQKRKREEKLRKELETPYKKWLNEDVTYIITDEERAAWKRLSTDEEREQFIEQFWLRRDPTPDTVENEFKEEHYRRIAYANEHYASGIPGWKADRGRIYITYGPPDEIESHPSGGSYQRPMEEGGGETSTYPFEQWRYRYIDGIGNDIIIEFVDPTMTGEYRMTMDPSEKDALLYVPNAGLTLMEQMGMASKTDRFNRTDGTHLGRSFGGTPASMNEFERLERFSKLQKPPAVKFKDLEAAVSSHITFNLLPIKVQADFIKVTNSSVLTNVTIQMQNKDLQFQMKDTVQKAVVNIYARITTMSRRVVNVFEDTVTVESPKELLQAVITKPSIYQKSIPLAPGMYRLNVVVKDVVGGNMNNYETALNVPHFDDEKLASSSLILADVIEKVPTRSIGTGQFVVGSSKVRPRIDDTFRHDEKMGIYLQLYNFGPDEKTQKPSGVVEYEVTKNGTNEKIFAFSEEIAKMPDASAQQVTIEKLLPLQTLKPGQYTLKMKVTDRNRNQTLTPTATFTVT
ncbi:MAG TPA: GWxTD domain-containing protein [Bryobacteraceae bacterium]|nr:GWxTD domain-containing protein [Bryobacteraceae bacterium]